MGPELGDYFWHYAPLYPVLLIGLGVVVLWTHSVVTSLWRKFQDYDQRERAALPGRVAEWEREYQERRGR